MIAALIFIWVTIFTTFYAVRKWVDSRKYPPIPGPPSLPFIGNAHNFVGKPEEVFKKVAAMVSEYKRMIGLYMGPKLYVAIFDPRDVEVVLRANRNQVEKADEYSFFKPWLGESILISSGAKFKAHKRVILPAFGMNVLKQFLETFNKHSKKMVKLLNKEVGKAEFNINDYLCVEAMNVFLETSMGVNCDTLGDQAVAYSKAVENLLKIVQIRLYTIWLRNDFLFKFSSLKKKQDECLAIVHPLTAHVIKQRRKEFMQRRQHEIETGEMDDRKKAILSDLLIEASQDGDGLSDQEIMDEVLTMMFAGQETTTGTTGFALSLIGLYPEVQEKVHNELDEVFGDSDRDITYEDICKLEYMERVINETLRLYPAIPYIGKKMKEDLKLEDGLILPKGCAVMIFVMQVHRNASCYENPHRFDPDNFLPEKVKARHPYSFLPFSAGARTCVGGRYAMLKMKVILSHILRSYNVYSTKRQREFRLSGQITLKRRDGTLLRIEPRNKKNILKTPNKDDKNPIIEAAEKVDEGSKCTSNETSRAQERVR